MAVAVAAPVAALAAPEAAIGLSTKNLVGAAGNLGGQLLQKGGDVNKINVSGVLAAGLTGNPFISEGLGQAFSWSGEAGFKGSFLLGKQNAGSFVVNTMIGGFTGAATNNYLKFAMSGGTGNLTSGLRDATLLGSNGARGLLGGFSIGANTLTGAGANAAQDVVTPTTQETDKKTP